MKNVLFIIWNDSNNTGIRIIDEQHRGIISTINSLYYFAQDGHGIEILKPILIMIEQYVEIHFRTEESLMKLSNYPEINEHIKLHKDLAAQAKMMLIDPKRGKEPAEVLRFLKEWWNYHINTEDRKYVPYLEKLIED